MTFTKNRSLPVLLPRTQRRRDWACHAKPAAAVASKSCAEGRDQQFWDSVESFAKQEVSLVGRAAGIGAFASTPRDEDHDQEFGSEDVRERPDMQLLADMGYRGPMYLSLMSRARKDALLHTQAVGDISKLRAALRGAQLNVGLDDPLVKRLKGVLKEADWGVRTCRQQSENMKAVGSVLSRMRGLDLGRHLWDDSTLAKARARFMAWKVSQLEDAAADVRKAACETLSAMNNATSPLQAASMATATHPAAMYAPRFAARFDDTSYDVRQAASLALSRFGDAGTAAVVSQIDGPTARARTTACECLGIMGERGAAHCEALARRLGDEDAAVRKAACLAFESLGPLGAAHIADVAACLRDDCANTRRAACSAVGSMGEARAAYADELGVLVGDDDEEVRRSARAVLLSMGNAGLSALRIAEVRAAASVLKRPAEETSRDDRRAALEAIAALAHSTGEDAHAAALYAQQVAAECCDDADPELRVAAVLSLGGIGGNDAAEERGAQLSKCLDDDNVDIRLAALSSLATTKDASEAQLSAMAAHLEDDSEEVRKAVCEALGSTTEDNPAATQHALQVAALLKSDDSAEVKEAAERALASMGKAGAAAANAVRAEDDDEDVRFAAIQSLAAHDMFRLSPAEQAQRQHEAASRQFEFDEEVMSDAEFSESEDAREDQEHVDTTEEPLPAGFQRPPSEPWQMPEADRGLPERRGKIQWKDSKRKRKRPRRYSEIEEEEIKATEGRKFAAMKAESSLDKYLGCPEREAEWHKLRAVALLTLKSRLKDMNARNRIAACEALADFNADAADIASYIRPLLDDDEAEVQKAARMCLIRIGGVGVDLVNGYDRECRAKQKRRVVQILRESWYWTAVKRVHKMGPQEAAFEVSSSVASSSFFGTSSEQQNKARLLDASEITVLKSDAAEYQKMEDGHDDVMERLKEKGLAQNRPKKAFSRKRVV